MLALGRRAVPPGALNAAAAAGWTVRDLDQLLVDLTAGGHQVLGEPLRPTSYPCHLLGLVDIGERPTAISDAHAVADLARHHTRTTAQLAARDTAAAPLPSPLLPDPGEPPH